MLAIEKITRKASRIRNGNDKIEPGQPVIVSEAISPDEHVRQGDVYLVFVKQIPHGFEQVHDLREIDKQLAPGNTQGARHVVDRLSGVEIWRHADFSHDAQYQGQWCDRLGMWMGPCLKMAESRTILHPKHGDVTWFPGAIVLVGYQREWDAEQARERRNAD